MKFGLIDLFSIPVSVFHTRRSRNIGSWFGLIMTLFSVASLISFMVYKLNEMLNYKLDNYKTVHYGNEFSDQYNNLSI